MSLPDQLALVWFGGWSVVAGFAFGWDKWRAGRSGPRVSEWTLVLFGALGGWLGGVVGMNVFRHKTAKWSFKLKYALGLLPFVAELWVWWQWR
jgi:uncharacterized membrane protein YsdA (DUF1294 family)